MPTQSIVFDAFKLDKIREDWWFNIKEISKEYGIGFWIENTDLFFMALKRRRVDFFLTFQKQLELIIRYISRIPVLIELDGDVKNNINYEYQSLLHYAFHIGDLRIINIILDVWVVNLNEDINDPLTQRLYHASYLFDSDDLFYLAKMYPSGFVKFILRTLMKLI